MRQSATELSGYLSAKLCRPRGDKGGQGTHIVGGIRRQRLNVGHKGLVEGDAHGRAAQRPALQSGGRTRGPRLSGQRLTAWQEIPAQFYANGGSPHTKRHARRRGLKHAGRAGAWEGPSPSSLLSSALPTSQDRGQELCGPPTFMYSCALETMEMYDLELVSLVAVL